MTLDLKTRASDDLLIGCHELIKNGDLTTPEETMAFFEKPWKWKEELQELGVNVE